MREFRVTDSNFNTVSVIADVFSEYDGKLYFYDDLGENAPATLGSRLQQVAIFAPGSWQWMTEKRANDPQNRVAQAF